MRLRTLSIIALACAPINVFAFALNDLLLGSNLLGRFMPLVIAPGILALLVVWLSDDSEGKVRK